MNPVFSVLFVVICHLSIQVQSASPRWEPQISVLCEAGQQYLPQYLSEDGRWTTELSIKVPGVSCLRDKMDLLDYCKKVYPGRDITNIVESSHYQKIGGWCRQGSVNSAKCKGAQRWIKPFRCLVPMKMKKTDLPVMPESEILPSLDDSEDNISEDSEDEEFDDDEDEMVADEPLDNLEDDSEDDEFDSDEDQTDMMGDNGNNYNYNNWDSMINTSQTNPNKDGSTSSATSTVSPSTSTSTTVYATSSTQPPPVVSTMSQTTEKPSDIPISPVGSDGATAIPTPDPYFTHFDPRMEHQSYKEAQQRLEEVHREKVTRVMKDWSDLEEKYQDMRLADPKSAQSFKQRMTARFQTSVQALEEEGNAEKHQLAAMHQQRVLAHINQRKREAMTCYTQALTELPPNGHRVEKCLQKLLRALHKDRAHALAHYRHLLSSGGTGGLEAAASERPRTLERLVDIDRAVNQSMTMLKRYPELNKKLSQLMEDYIQALRSKDETPGSLLAMTEDAESAILDKYRTEIERKVNEKERQRIAEKQRKEERAQEREKIREEKLRLQAKNMEKMYRQQQKEQEETKTESQMTSKDQTEQTEIKETTMEYTEESVYVTSPTPLPTVDDAAVQRAVEEVASAIAHQEVEPRMQHVMAHDLGHGEASFSVRREVFGPGSREERNVYYTVGFAGVALMAAVFVGVAVAKYRAARSPHAQGFVEVDQTVAVPVTPEERHVANMQINGYENPTYKYFEVKE